MRAFLHPDLEVRGTTLRDARLDCSYGLSPDAAWVIRQLQQESHLERLSERIVVHKHISRAEAALAVQSTCGQLGQLGGVRMEWGTSFSWLARAKAAAGWRHREPATTVGFMRSMLRAYGLLCAALLGLCLYGRIIAGDMFSWWLLAAPLAVGISCVVHEAGHVLAARQARVTAVLLASTGYMALMYRRPAQTVMRRIAAAGPLCVVAICVVAVVIADGFFMRFVSASTAVLHAVCLLPVCADGRAIWSRSR